VNRSRGLSVVLTGDVVNAAGEVGQFAGDSLHVATIHVVVDPAHIAHVRSQTFQFFVATSTATIVKYMYSEDIYNHGAAVVSRRRHEECGGGRVQAIQYIVIQLRFYVA